eukprot:GHUV01025369.1.p1 GENE.GHUV01025369.1~~GHUV01025369.1.p1  ORF type:complete len:108 (-),score=14.79 GHUV01025369.1:1062-1385(-)
MYAVPVSYSESHFRKQRLQCGGDGKGPRDGHSRQLTQALQARNHICNTPSHSSSPTLYPEILPTFLLYLLLWKARLLLPAAVLAVPCVVCYRPVPTAQRVCRRTLTA